MAETKRVIIGSEQNDDRKIELQICGTTITLPVSIIDGSGNVSLPAGTNNIGDIDVLTLPATVIAGMTSLPAGTATIGKVSLVDLSGDEINWADTTNNAFRVNVVAGGAGDGAILDGVNSAIKATVLDYANSNPLAVRLTDIAGDYVAAGGGTQYADGAARGTATGTLMMVDDGTNIQSAAGTTGGLLKVDLSGTAANATAIKVDGSAVTQPVSGTFWQATQPVSIAAVVSTNWNGTAPPIGAGLEATALRVTLATDSTGLVSVDDNGGSLSIDDAGGSITVDGTFWQATQPISAASLPLPTGAATSALQGAGLPAALGAGGGLKVDGSGTALPVTGTITAVTAITNALPAGTNTIGNVGHGKTLKTVTGSIAATTTIVSAVAGAKLKVIAFSLITSSTTAVTATFKSGAAGTALWTVPLQALSGTISGVNLAVSMPAHIFETGVNTLLELSLSAAQTVVYSVSYFEEA